MSDLQALFSAAQNLNQTDLQVLSSHILSMLHGCFGERQESIEAVKVSHCQRCNSEHIVKYGKDKNRKQRYKCKNCGIVFYADSFTVTSKTRHDMETWKRFVELLLSRASLAKCASACKISVQTAFTWRHKILNALQKDQTNRVLGGIIEADETYFGINYKGNHTKSRSFVMPRESRKRGRDCKDQIGSRACVMYAVERNGQVYGEVLGKGQPTIAMLTHAFDKRIITESIFLTDKSVSLRNYFTNYTSGIQLIQLQAHLNPKNMNSPPEVRGVFHIQSVNNGHHRLRAFLTAYNGVSTKYLNHYVNLFIWIENHKRIDNVNLEDELRASLNTSDSYISYNEIINLPAIPVVA